MNYVYRSYKVLDEIFRNSAFSSIELNRALNVAEEKEKGIITKIVYGVLDNSIKYDYIISALTEKKPKNAIITLLKVGMFLLYEMNSVPAYAAIDECVKIAAKISHGALNGFVNGFLRKAQNYEIVYPKDPVKALSVKYSKPELLVSKMTEEFGLSLTENAFNVSTDGLECVRSNGKLMSGIAFDNELRALDIPFTRLLDNAFEVKLTDLKKIPRNKYTVQALASIIAVDELNVKNTDSVLDVCSAPGGKAVYAAEKAKRVVACDIYAHRLNLIKSYAERMKVSNVSTELNDGTKLNDKFIGMFDKVICDAPCSGVGVFSSKPDILLSLTNEKISELAKLQYEILSTSVNYLRHGGTIVYSTCTMFKEENDLVIKRFLSEHVSCELQEITDIKVPFVKTEYGAQLLPNYSKTVGFYICKLRKI